MTTIEELQKEIALIKQRNKKVEADKAWETSLYRKGLVVVLTYVVMILVMNSLGFERIFISAIIPTLGYFLSTLTVSFFKKRWISQHYK